jgi:peptide/nickel transport system permease protein
MGFNDPFLVQYGRFLGGALRGNFGDSIRHGEPAFQLVVERMPATFELAGAALLIALCLAIPAGIVSAVRRNTVLDYVSTVVALLGQSMPTFWLGIMLILLFSVQLQWLPSSGRGELRHLILPAVTLGLFTTARITRLTRSGMLEVLGQDYIRTARAKGTRSSGPPAASGRCSCGGSDAAGRRSSAPPSWRWSSSPRSPPPGSRRSIRSSSRSASG